MDLKKYLFQANVGFYICLRKNSNDFVRVSAVNFTSDLTV